jgi:hypothetical protein
MCMLGTSKIVGSAPIRARRCLPTLDRPRIVPQSRQSLHRADARVKKMVVTPVQHQAIRMHCRLDWLLGKRALLARSAHLAAGSQAKKAKHAKCA